ncbi:hypothetical protein PT974_09255 [Cladobotryum mycophilum]|uniref:Uncharacterized protein n=1 Tax=Cladobotryum mycophilum TaxID=491253 RepID=A0ABR0SGX6_9HYPO
MTCHVVQLLTKETADPNAATAAASAFMRRDPSQSLSSAAAAAALRARPITPTNVANVQSKRIQRRNSSISSTASRDGGRKGELRRTPSVGSMTERTFRTPSPGRSPAPRARNVPPIPNVPITQHISSITTAERGDGKPLKTQPFQTASQKVEDRQGSWFGAATARESIPVRGDFSSPSSTLPEQRPGSVSPSINFSYPRSRTSLQVNASSSPTPDQELVYDANSRRMVPRAELVARSLSIGNFPETPMKAKKKKNKNKKAGQDSSRSGSHLSKGTITRAKIGPAGDFLPEAAVTVPLDPSHPDQASSTGPCKDRGLESYAKETVAPSPVMPLSSEKEGKAHEEIQNSQDELWIQTMDTNTPPNGTTSPIGNSAKSEEKLNPDIGSIRVQSDSPLRSARFASPTDQLVVKHEPPPRSLSPRKSALKLSNSVRGLSPAPSNDGSEISVFDSSQRNKEDPATGRRKSVRVSWDDNNTIVVGEAAQLQETDPSFIPSPQGKKPWHSIIGRYSKKDSTSLDEEETMSPRPALPLFGSVREKKTRELEERPLVRPYETTWAHLSENTSPQTDATIPRTGFNQSGEAISGTVPPQEQSSRNEANISKYREPLPPILASKEINLEDSDDSLSSEDEVDAHNFSKSRNTNHKTKVQQKLNDSTTSLDDLDKGISKRNSIPTISISHPSPQKQGLESTTPVGAQATVPTHNYEGTTEGGDSKTDNISTSIPSVLAQSTESPVLNSVLQMDDIKEEEEEEEGSDQGSIYSDAYEDLSEVEGDGFMSLDAVLEAPSIAKSLTETTSKESLASESRFKNLPQANEDWEKAKAYWKSLSSNERRLLEKEALEEGDGEVLPDKGSTVNKEVMSDSDRSNQNGQNQHAHSILQDSESEPRSTLHKTLLKRIGVQQLKSMPVSGDKESAMPTSQITKPVGSTSTSRPGTAGAQNTLRTEDGIRKSLRPRTPKTDEAHNLGPFLRLTTSRPASYHHPPTMGEPSQYYQNHSMDSLVPHSNATIAPSLASKWKRRGSDSSESSFTRTRTTTTLRQGFRFSMRGSMRETTSSDGDKTSSRFSLRSLSPAGSGFRRNSISSMPSSGARMRQSMRQGSSNSRSPHVRMTSLGQPSIKNSIKSKGGSRFTDSSDEDDDHPSLFRSRFVDSSDEEGPTTSKTKGRSLPKPFLSKATSTVTAQLSPETALTDNKKGTSLRAASSSGIYNTSITSSLKQNQPNNGEAISSTNAPPHANHETEPSRRSASHRGSFISKLRRKGDPKSKTSQAFSQPTTLNDAWLGNNASQRATTQSNGVANQRTSWPLPDHSDADGDDSDTLHHDPPLDKHRPSTTGGPEVGTTLKSSFFSGQHNLQGLTSLSPIASESAPDLPHKKKKFGVLRKMFRLQD